MNIEAVNSQSSIQFNLNRAPVQVSDARKKVQDQALTEPIEKKQIQPEELLKQIKALTQDGLYSVRFENDERTNSMVVKIVDRESDEIIRQVPAEEMLALKSVLQDLRGNIVDAEV